MFSTLKEKSKDILFCICETGKRTMSDKFLFQHFLRKDWKGSNLLSKKRQKKHKRKVLITSRRFNWRYFSKWRTTQPWLYLILAFDDIQLRLIRSLNLPSFLFIRHFLFIFIFLLFCCCMGNEEARHKAEKETSKWKRGRPSKNAEKEREWIDEETLN